MMGHVGRSGKINFQDEKPPCIMNIVNIELLDHSMVIEDK